VGVKTNKDATYPRIMETAKAGICPDKRGITAYYSSTCPFTYYITTQINY